MATKRTIPSGATAIEILEIAHAMLESSDINEKSQAMDMAVRASITAFSELGVDDERLEPLMRLHVALTDRYYGVTDPLLARARVGSTIDRSPRWVSRIIAAGALELRLRLGESPGIARSQVSKDFGVESEALRKWHVTAFRKNNIKVIETSSLVRAASKVVTAAIQKADHPEKIETTYAQLPDLRKSQLAE